GVPIAHFPTIVENIAGLLAHVDGAEILRVVEEGFCDVFSSAEFCTESSKCDDERVRVGRTVRIFVIDVDAVETVLVDCIFALYRETVGLGIGCETAPAGGFMVAEYIEQHFYSQ